ncbi:hypothetical protein GHT06_003516 [Daphnia sinensis]|uniref:RagB/SusD domain-containing protein n=1 Tax=Daphnia sinensis TaxID=1820382 RepID=A0AAD5KEK2_9CRUS|nr:hypothetical protein GHT06_003516 [Daphnia sinensis]
MDLTGDLNAGPSHPYGASPDVFNPVFYLPNAAVNTIIVVHPSVLRDTTAGDLRVKRKFFKRTTAVTVTTDAAEAHANLDQATLAVEAINIIRKAAGISPYSGGTTKAELIDEILYQRRYSLWAEPWDIAGSTLDDMVN